MSAPVINIQEAAALYVRIMKANPDSFSQRVKSIPPYKTTVLIHQDVIGGKMYSFIQKVTFSDGITKISTFIIKENKPIDWLGSTEYPDAEEGWERSSWPVGNVADINHRYDDDFWWSVLETRTCVAIFGLTLMNCKNISYNPYDPNKYISQGRKGNNKKFNRPYVKYEILEIQPMKERTFDMKKPVEHRETENNQSLHTVRGHFKTYRAERPLFGKYTGTYWWGDCVKGNAEIGIIEKDYKLRIKVEDFKITMSKSQGGVFKC